MRVKNVSGILLKVRMKSLGCPISRMGTTVISMAVTGAKYRMNTMEIYRTQVTGRQVLCAAQVVMAV